MLLWFRMTKNLTHHVLVIHEITTKFYISQPFTIHVRCIIHVVSMYVSTRVQVSAAEEISSVHSLVTVHHRPIQRWVSSVIKGRKDSSIPPKLFLENSMGVSIHLFSNTILILGVHHKICKFYLSFFKITIT